MLDMILMINQRSKNIIFYLKSS